MLQLYCMFLYNKSRQKLYWSGGVGSEGWGGDGELGDFSRQGSSCKKSINIILHHLELVFFNKKCAIYDRRRLRTLGTGKRTKKIWRRERERTRERERVSEREKKRERDRETQETTQTVYGLCNSYKRLKKGLTTSKRKKESEREIERECCILYCFYSYRCLRYLISLFVF